MAESAEPFDYSSTYPQLSTNDCLGHLPSVAEQMAQQECVIKMTDNRQERVWQHGKCSPLAVWKFTEVTLDIDLKWFLRVGSWVVSVADD